MNKKCIKYHMLDIIIDGNIIRKGKYSKVMSPVTHTWVDYKGDLVVNEQEIQRLNNEHNTSNEVSEDFDDYQHFMTSSSVVNDLSSIPMTDHILVSVASTDLGQIFADMRFNKGVDGDSYTLFVTNSGDKPFTLYVPTQKDDDKSNPDINNAVKYVNVGSIYVSIGSGKTERINITYKDNTWYWEVLAKQAESQGNVQLGDVDFLVFRYLWDSAAGRDLDTATELLNSNIPNVDNKAVGWSCPGNNIPEVKSILKWGGDNRGSGQECVFLDVSELRSKYMDVMPDITEFMAYATWYASKGTGQASFNLMAYKGGSMVQEGFNFINQGGETIYNSIHNFEVTTVRGVSDYKNDYTSITKVYYNKTTNSVSMTVGDASTPQDQIDDLKARMAKAEKNILDMQTVINTELIATSNALGETGDLL